MYDAAIIGTGPAGLSAAINLKLHEKRFIWFGSMEFSEKVSKSEKIANYPGVGLITGAELNAQFAAHAAQLGLTVEDRMVTNIMAMNDHFMLLGDNEIFEAKTVLLATGVVSAKGIDGEKELLGKGVSYCATCDGFFYKGKTIAVYCGARRYEHEVEYLAGIAEKVYLYTPYKDCGVSLSNVETIPVITAIEGDKRVTGIRLFDGTAIEVNGVFCLRNAVAPSTLINGIKTEGAHIVVDRCQRTSIPGCFAAGDCTGRPYQLTKAVGEGNVAAHSMLEYLSGGSQEH